MSPVAKWILVCTCFAFAAGFAYLAIAFGAIFPRGPLPFYVFAGVCAVAGLFALRVRPVTYEELFIPQSGQPEAQSSPHPRPGTSATISPDPDDISIHAVDLTRLSPAGCLLFLSTLVVIGIALVIVVSLEPAARRGEKPSKIMAYVALGAGAAWFIAGRFLIKQLGFKFLRKR